MRLVRRLVGSIRALLERERVEQDLDDEMRSYVEAAIEQKRSAGLNEKDATRAARGDVGSIAAVKDRVRDVGWESVVDGIRQDILFGLKTLVRAPGFTSVVVLTLAVGIGASAAIFSVINAVLLADLPYAAPAELVRVTESFPAIGEGRLGVSSAEFRDYRDRSRAFGSIAGYTRATLDLAGADGPEPVEVLQATASLFTTLGVSPRLGRTLTTFDESVGAPKVAVISFDFWHRRYAESGHVIGTSLTLNEQPHTVVGVMPPGFEFPAGRAGGEPPVVWMPLVVTPQQLADRAGNFSTGVVARLRPGTSLEQAREDVGRVAAEFQREHPDIYNDRFRLDARVDRLTSEGAAEAAPLLLILAVTVAVVLIAVAANVAGLLLVRANQRQREIAIRRALGAGKGRVVRQLLIEALLLSGLAGLLGYLITAGLIELAASLPQAPSVWIRGVRVDSTVLMFAVALSGVTGVICGLAPAVELARVNIVDTLKRAGRHPRGGRGRWLFQRTLVRIEIAAALVLLIGAALLVRSFVKVLDVPLGFDPNGVVIARTSFSRERYPDQDRRRQTEQRIVAEMAALPGVTASGLTTHLPLADERMIGYALEKDRPTQIHWATQALVSPEYFSVMRIPVASGRVFSDTDTPSAPPVAVINQTLARMHWPNHDPIGERVVWGGRHLTIIGVVGDVHVTSVDAVVPPALYCSVYQVESGATTSAVFVLRGGDGDRSLTSAARRVIQSVDRGLPAFDVRNMTQVIARSLHERRLTLASLGAFAVIALALALVGLHSVLAHAVATRTHELGVRLALGATPGGLVAMVMKDGVSLAATGLAIGALVAGGAVRGLSTALFGIDAMDPVAFVAAACLLLALAAAASYGVARRAAAVDPLTALRGE